MTKSYSSFLSAKIFTMVGQVRVHKRERILERVVVKFNIFVDKLKKIIYNYLGLAILVNISESTLSLLLL